PPRGLERAEALILVRLARLQPRGLADHAGAADLLLSALAVDDQPPPADELAGGVRIVLDDDRVPEEELAVVRVRLVGQEVGRRATPGDGALEPTRQAQLG